MVDFGGWEMPVQYSGILDEHHAVRKGVGLFDVSHMGEIEVHGPQSLQLVNWVTTNDAARLKQGQAHYSALLYEHGGFVDDILVHKVMDSDGITQLLSPAGWALLSIRRLGGYGSGAARSWATSTRRRSPTGLRHRSD